MDDRMKIREAGMDFGRQLADPEFFDAVASLRVSDDVPILIALPHETIHHIIQRSAKPKASSMVIAILLPAEPSGFGLLGCTIVPANTPEVGACFSVGPGVKAETLFWAVKTARTGFSLPETEALYAVSEAEAMYAVTAAL